jgi:hypothetical protein
MGIFFLDFNPIVFLHLLDQLQIIDTNNSIHFYRPSQPVLVQPFKKTIRKLDHHFSSSEKQNIITFNVCGQIFSNRRTTFTQVSGLPNRNLQYKTRRKFRRFLLKSGSFLVVFFPRKTGVFAY